MKTKLAFHMIAAAGFAFASLAYAGGVVDGTQNPYHVAGESLDSGLGELSASYDGSEYIHVAGEKLDSGLGELASDYDAREYDQTRVAGEKLDSGLGQLTRADVMKYARAQ